MDMFRVKMPGRGIIGGKKLIASAFRIVALLLAIIHLAFFTTDRNDIVSPMTLIISATLYTAFRLALPYKWYQTSISPILIALDLVAGAALVLLSGELHGPFVLYSLTPIVTSALILSSRATLVTAGVTGFYTTMVFFMNPLPVIEDHIVSELAIYLTAVGLAAMLPYVVNIRSEQQLQSRGKRTERLRIGREIHDGLCQNVYGVRWEIQTLRKDPKCTGNIARRLQQIESMLEEAERDVRGSIELLRAIRSDRPLLPQIENYLKHLENEAGINCLLIAEGGEPSLDEIVKLEVLHICGEALQNAAKHSRASNITVKVRSRNGHLQMNIADDGRGIQNIKFLEGHGLMVMKERAESIGGWLHVNSVPGTGTEIQAEVPRQCPLELSALN